MEAELPAALMKVGVFVLVQALVYLILAQSSTVFSRTSRVDKRLRQAPSLGARRMVALLTDTDMPPGGELSPVAVDAGTKRSSPVLAHQKDD